MKHLIIIAAALIALASCSTKKTATDTTAPGNVTVASLVGRAASIKPAADITARCDYSLRIAGKDMTLGGSLKMQRDKIIQMSVTMLGIEMARLELTPEQITIIDRINKRFIRGRYDEVAFARDNNLDFRVAQALFWGELFTLDGKTSPESFTLNQSGEYALLTTRNDALTVTFLTSIANANVRQTTIADTAHPERTLVMNYNAREGGQPTDFTLAATGLKDKMSMGFALTNLRLNTAKTITPTAIDTDRYRQIPATTALSSILGL